MSNQCNCRTTWLNPIQGQKDSYYIGPNLVTYYSEPHTYVEKCCYDAYHIGGDNNCLISQDNREYIISRFEYKYMRYIIVPNDNNEDIVKTVYRLIPKQHDEYHGLDDTIINVTRSPPVPYCDKLINYESFKSMKDLTKELHDRNMKRQQLLNNKNES